MKTVVFSDFDGTISCRDIGYSLFHNFSGGKNDDFIPDWKAGKMSSKEVLRREAAIMRATKEELREYISGFEIDNGFPDFVSHCRTSGIPLTVVSDGLDIYIKILLEKFGFGDLEWSSNRAIIEGDKMRIEFPNASVECERCGNCKGVAIRKFRRSNNSEMKIVYIGDGYSDACAAGEADILFAKKDLEQYCQDNNIEYEKFANFHDVKKRMRELGCFE